MGNQAIINKGQKYVMNTYGRYSLALVKGQGCKVWDADGKEYLDFVGGIAVCGLGHAHPELVKVLQEQSQKLWHVSNLYWIEPQVELAEKLCQATGMDKAFFANSGAEVNEGAIKLARKYFYRKGQDRYEIIAMKNSFHGRTLATLSVTGQTKYQEGYAPLLPGVKFAEINNLDSVASLITDKTAAVIVEPVQAEGGVNPSTTEFLQGLRKLCNEKGILLIFDEVQCGMGRTGKAMAYQHYGIKPDIVTLAKALAGGFPIGALLATEEAVTGFAPGDHASTFGGNPLACAVACKSVELLTEPAFLQNVVDTGEYLKEKLQEIVDTEASAKEVRGLGLLIGVEFDTEVKDLVNLCIANGLLVISAGPNVLRMVPPLNINKADVDAAVEILQKALEQWKAY
ncbi:MAG: aspartate aminotransferase family protein [Deltaproteobacteria bacterium]